jgi:hypothetical protein
VRLLGNNGYANAPQCYVYTYIAYLVIFSSYNHVTGVKFGYSIMHLKSIWCSRCPYNDHYCCWFVTRNLYRSGLSGRLTTNFVLQNDRDFMEVIHLRTYTPMFDAWLLPPSAIFSVLYNLIRSGVTSSFGLSLTKFLSNINTNMRCWTLIY